MNWQPIKTAPNDLTEVLVWDGKECWIAEQNPQGYWSAKLSYAGDSGFYLDSAEDTGLTHWMQLPEPPK